MGNRLLGVAWKIILIADLGVLLYGIMAVFSPKIFREGFQVYTGQNWDALVSLGSKAADYILLLARLTGALNIAFGVVAVPIIVKSFRRTEPWSWYALLLGNSLAYLGPITFDQVVGFVGFFEQLEIVLLALVYAALCISAKDFLRKKTRTSNVPTLGGSGK